MRLLQFVYCAAAARALQLPTTWGSSMVLEANAPNKLWGLDASGSTVSVTAFGRTYNATADSSGAWSVLIAAQPKSTLPSTISIASTSGGAATLSDVLVGYTAVCSGQSNMELNVGATYN
jgi:sialate O-acetylesterase